MLNTYTIFVRLNSNEVNSVSGSSEITELNLKVKANDLKEAVNLMYARIDAFGGYSVKTFSIH